MEQTIDNTPQSKGKIIIPIINESTPKSRKNSKNKNTKYL